MALEVLPTSLLLLSVQALLENLYPAIYLWGFLSSEEPGLRPRQGTCGDYRVTDGIQTITGFTSSMRILNQRKVLYR